MSILTYATTTFGMQVAQPRRFTGDYTGSAAAWIVVGHAGSQLHSGDSPSAGIPLPAWKRHAIVESIIGSQAIEGIQLDPVDVGQAVDRAYSRPLISLD